MGNWYSAYHIAKDHIHTDITCNTEDPEQKYRFGTVSNILLGGLSTFYWIQTSPSASAMVQPNQTITTNSTNQHKTFSIYFFFKSAAYFSLVRPILQYCSTVWSPYSQEYINKAEMVQCRAARHVTNRYRNTSSVTSMLGHLEWERLESRRTKA